MSKWYNLFFDFIVKVEELLNSKLNRNRD